MIGLWIGLPGEGGTDLLGTRDLQSDAVAKMMPLKPAEGTAWADIYFATIEKRRGKGMSITPIGAERCAFGLLRKGQDGAA